MPATPFNQSRSAEIMEAVQARNDPNDLMGKALVCVAMMVRTELVLPLEEKFDILNMMRDAIFLLEPRFCTPEGKKLLDISLKILAIDLNINLGA